ncbi:MAG TPA: DUF6318 family protein, partial [Egibacteraceae bacterium]|nr:DUF6318 family protein [Egibacteraceae bacterium]
EEPPATLPSVTAEPTPTVTIPPPPPETDGEDNVAAAEFAKYYLRVLSAAFQAGDPAPVRALTHDSCGGCHNLIAFLEELEAAGQHVQGGEYLVSTAVAPGDTAGDVTVDVRYEIASGEVVDSSGDPVRELPAEPLTDAQLRVVRDATGWRTHGYRIVGAT